MNLRLEILLLMVGGILRILGVGINIWYFISQRFENTTLYYISGAFLIAPSVVFFTLTLVFVLADCCKGRFRTLHFKLGLGLLITVGGPVGVPLFVYAGLLACNETNTGDFYILEGLSRATSLVESLFESLPQICIQMYNNISLRNWQTLNIVSITISLLGIFYTSYKLCYAIDRVQHYEQASAIVSSAKTLNVESKTLTDRKLAVELEVYECP